MISLVTDHGLTPIAYWTWRMDQILTRTQARARVVRPCESRFCTYTRKMEFVHLNPRLSELNGQEPCTRTSNTHVVTKFWQLNVYRAWSKNRRQLPWKNWIFCIKCKKYSFTNVECITWNMCVLYWVIFSRYRINH